MTPRQAIGLIISLALLWFVAVFFSVYPLTPSFAFQAALVAFVGVMIAYQILDAIDHLTLGAVITMLLIPLIIIAAGIVWWGMRLFGFPGIIGD